MYDNEMFSNQNIVLVKTYETSRFNIGTMLTADYSYI